MTQTNNMLIITTSSGLNGTGTLKDLGINNTLKSCKVTLVGGGGSGENDKANDCNGGGGAGGCVIAYLDTIDPYTNFTVGKGGSNQDGKANNGEATSLGEGFLIAGGGIAGNGKSGGEGGTAYSTVLTALSIRGSNGQNAFNSNIFTSYSGAGANSILGGGGASAPTDLLSRTEYQNGAKNSGSGGAGANQMDSVYGAGADGVIIIEYTIEV